MHSGVGTESSADQRASGLGFATECWIETLKNGTCVAWLPSYHQWNHQQSQQERREIAGAFNNISALCIKLFLWLAYFPSFSIVYLTKAPSSSNHISSCLLQLPSNFVLTHIVNTWHANYALAFHAVASQKQGNKMPKDPKLVHLTSKSPPLVSVLHRDTGEGGTELPAPWDFKAG